MRQLSSVRRREECRIEINSLSKTYGLAGARIGFALGNKDVIAKLKALKLNLDYGMFLPVQKAAVAALTGPQDCVASTRLAYQHRRDVLVDGLNRIGRKIDKCGRARYTGSGVRPFRRRTCAHCACTG